MVPGSGALAGPGSAADALGVFGARGGPPFVVGSARGFFFSTGAGLSKASGRRFFVRAALASRYALISSALGIGFLVSSFGMSLNSAWAKSRAARRLLDGDWRR